MSGAVGDLGTLLPLLTNVAAKGTIDMGNAIFWMGVFNIIIAFLWDIPMPVQPMKSICAVAISDGMTPGAFSAAGILTGAMVAFIGVTRLIEVVNMLIAPSVIAGMQIGLGVKMAASGCANWLDHTWIDDIDCRVTALVCLLLTLFLLLRTNLPTALIIFAGGLVLTIVEMVHRHDHFQFGLLHFKVYVPTAHEWKDGLVRGALPQLPLTLANSCISVCALSVSLFGDAKDGGKGASRIGVTSSIGLMNCVGPWFGGMPSCHGAGGLAAQYKFGARGGMSILILGTGKVLLALVLGETLNSIIAAFPRTVLGVMLLFAGVELASVGARSLRLSDDYDADLLPCFVTAGAYIGVKNMALAVLVGIAASALTPGGYRHAVKQSPSSLPLPKVERDSGGQPQQREPLVDQKHTEP